MNNKFLYIAKQIVKGEEKKHIIVSCPSANEFDFKNKCFASLVEALNTVSDDYYVVNFDSKYSGESNINIDTKNDITSLDINNIEGAAEHSLVIVNAPCIIGNEFLFTDNNDIDDIVLTVKYGQTNYSSLEKAIDILKDNGINLLGVVARKQKLFSK